MTLEILPGQVVAIVGPNGGGKSTFFKILYGLIRHEEGEIFLNNQNIAELDPASIRKHCAIVPQTPAIMTGGTFATNIKCNAPKASIEDVLQVMQDVGLNSFKPEDPIKFNFSGPELSGGQCQRVNFARALLSIRQNDIKYLFVDEGTSALDATGEQTILNILMKEVASKNITMFFITHNMEHVQSIIMQSRGVGFDKIVDVNKFHAKPPVPPRSKASNAFFPTNNGEIEIKVLNPTHTTSTNLSLNS